MRKLAVVAAGGTGGHLFPAQALAEAMIARGWRIVLASDERAAAFAESFPAQERIGLSARTFRRGDVVSMAQAGIAIVRLSGPGAFVVADRVFQCPPPLPSSRPGGTFVHGFAVDGEAKILLYDTWIG